MQHDLEIVIPFYKPDYFERLLHSLASQTDRSFNITIGNDASTQEAEAIVARYAHILHIKYHYFENRLGNVDLARQWNRCVSLSSGSKWLWVVPDDDLPSSKCVEALRAASNQADQTGANVIHLPCTTIDKNEVLLSAPEDLPTLMNSDEFYLKQLQGKTAGSSLANAVYRRSKFDDLGGFRSLPRGWGSDHATMLAVADGGPIINTSGAWLNFRMSGINISSLSNDAAEKMEARIIFARWLKKASERWYGEEKSALIMKWFYFKGEFYARKIWPFSLRNMELLFELARACGIPRTTVQRVSIAACCYGSHIERVLRKKGVIPSWGPSNPLNF